MFCIKCDNDIAECTCPDAAERIPRLLEPSRYLIIGPEYAERLKKHAEKLESQKTVTE